MILKLNLDDTTVWLLSSVGRAMHCREGGAYFVLGGGGGANKQVPGTLTSRGFWGNSTPENFQILKLRNATFSILGAISKRLTWINHKNRFNIFIFCLKLRGLKPPQPPGSAVPASTLQRS